MTRLVLLGDPVDHSLSPAMHAAAFGHWGLAARYDAVQVAARDVEPTMREVRGGNVTLPHKAVAASALDRASDTVRLTGACNCFWREEGALVGDNTDVGGLEAALRAASMSVAGGRVLLLGAGGAARAAALASLRGDARSVEVWNRTPARARDLAATLADPRIRPLETAPRGPYDLVLNATRLGLEPTDPLPLDLGAIEAAAAFDLVYGPDGTGWTRHARALGIPSADGLGMLVEQAALSLRRWFPDREPPVATMRRAAEAELSRRLASAPRPPGSDE